MSEIINCFSQAELALASYTNLQAGIPDPLKLQDNGDGLSAKQAELFAQKYSVITQYNDTLAEGGQGTGLSATVFVDKASNELTLAIRGTELSDSRDLSTGAVMLAEGVAYDQVLALYNWWLRATTPTTDTALQYAIVPGPIDPHDGFQFGARWLKILPPVAGSGELANVIGLDPDHKLDVTGHSLGGHLAMAFSTLFPGFAAQATAFNAPGFKNNTTNQAFFAALGGTVPTGGAITNVIADEANIGGTPMNIVAGANSQPGTVVTIAIESQYLSDEPNKPTAKNHSQQTLTDALAVNAFLSKLDPDLSTASFKSILNAATSGTAASLERIIDAIERVFGINSAELPAGNNNRDDLYKALYALDKDDSPLASVFGQVTVALAPENIGTRAQGDFSALVSLITLCPIVLSGDATLLESTLGAAWGAELAQWHADQAPTPEEFESGLANYSPHYLHDRARMLAKLILGNQQDAVTSGQTMYLLDTQSGNTDLWKFIDETSGRQVVVSPPTAWANHEIYFGDGQNSTHFGGLSDDTLYGGDGKDRLDGDQGNDYLEGNADNDSLTGGEGSDTLVGGAGDDTLYGGSGFDRYIFNISEFGNDTIFDADDDGLIIFRKVRSDGQTTDLAANGLFTKNGDSSWTHLLGDGSTVSLSHINSQWRIATGSDDWIVINNNFESGNFGIFLENTVAIPSSVITPREISSSPYDDYYRYEATGSNGSDYIFPVSPQGKVSSIVHGLGGDDVIVGFNSAPIFQYSFINEVLLGGDDGNDSIYVLGQTSLAEAILVGNQPTYTDPELPTYFALLDGGHGDDLLVGSSEFDLLLGGYGRDTLLGGGGDDELRGDTSSPELRHDGQISEIAGLGAASEDMGDVLYGGSGDDAIEGRLGDDYIDGGIDDDFLFGGDGSDIIYGGDDNDILSDDQYFSRNPEGMSKRLGDLKVWNDVLDGGLGNDQIFVYSGNNTIIGGAGNDVIVEATFLENINIRAEDKDILIFKRGDGNDIVKGTGATLILKFPDIFTLNDFSLEIHTDNNVQILTLYYGSGDKIVFDIYLVYSAKESWKNIQIIELGDGSTLSLPELIKSKLLTPINWVGTESGDTITGGSANDTLDGGNGNDTLDGGTGDDTLYGGDGNDTYRFGKGDGQDIIRYDYDTAPGKLNVLQFKSGVLPNEVVINRTGNDLLLSIAGTNDKITLEEFFYPDDPASNPYYNPVQLIKFADGTSWDLATIINQASGTNHAPTGGVTVSGTATQNQTLTAANTLADIDGLGAIVYQWQSSTDGTSWANITGATASSFTLSQAQVGRQVRVACSYTDGRDTLERTTSMATAAITNVNDAPTGAVIVAGAAARNQILSASNTLADDDGMGAIAYQWQSSPDGINWNAISGATTSSFTLGNAQIGLRIRVAASYIDGLGSAESVTSAATVTVANDNNAPTGSVSVSGTTTQNQTLLATNTLDDADGLGGLTYQWQSSTDGSHWSAIAGATASSLTLTEAQVGQQIRATASYIDGHGTFESKTSSATAPIENVNDAPTGTVTANGSVAQNQILTAANTLADIDGMGTIGYQWQSSGDGTHWSAIAGATTGSLTLGEALVGMQVRVAASYTDGHGTLESKLSAATAAISNVNDTPTGTVTISGTATQNQTLTAANTLADIDGLGTIGYQWQSSSDGTNWSTIAGATTSSFTLGETQVGMQVRVAASYTDGHGTAESIASSSTTVIANVNDAPTGTVVLSGTATQNQTLTAANTLADIDGLGAVAYQWQSSADGDSWRAIVGATASSLTLSEAQVGQQVRVAASYIDGHGTLESKASSATAAIAPAIDAPVIAHGGAGNDTLTGLSGDDQLDGGAGNDTLLGGAGNDTLIGGSGSDALYGGAGEDTLQVAVDGNWSSAYAAYNIGSPGQSGSGELYAIVGKVRLFDLFDGGSGDDLLQGTSGNDAIFLDDGFSPLPGTMGARLVSIEAIRAGDGDDVVDLTSDRYACGNVLLAGGNGNDVLWASAGNDALEGGAGNDRLYGGTGSDLLAGGSGADLIDGARGTDLLIGGAGNDTLITGTGADLIAFNQGDGFDAVTVGTGSTALSLGGGIAYGALSLRKSGNDLVLDTGGGDGMSFKNWYLGTANRNVLKLQVVAEAMAGFDSGGSDPLLDQKIENFDFKGLVGAFDDAGAATPTLSSWALTSALTQFHLAGSDSAALGGDLAYQYGRNGTLAGVGVSAAQQVLGEAGFGSQAQTLQPLAGLQVGAQRLS